MKTIDAERVWEIFGRSISLSKRANGGFLIGEAFAAHRGPRILGLSLFALLLLSPVPSRGQAIGEIVGMITDPSGAIVPSATITATQQGTGFRRTTVSMSTGNYTLPNLPVGTYTVTADAAGFKKAESTGVTLDVNQQREVDFTLVLPGTTQRVEVSAAPPLLDTTNGELGGLVTGQQVITLPLNGRDITELVMLQPGVNMEVDSSLPLTSNPSGNNFVASNGNRGTTGASYLDGLDTSDNAFGGGNMTNFNLDAIAEFKVLQNNYSAEYGRGAGTLTQIVSKSGTNTLHGSGFEFVRNSAFDSRNFFATSVAPFKRNEFGGTLGGPVLLPDLYNGKDRTFFFVQYAGFRQRLGEPDLISVPTAAERQGIVDIVGANNQADQLMVPLNSAAGAILNSYPMPNQPNGPFGANTFNFEYSIPQDTNQFSVRLDHRISDKDSLFVRATVDNNREPIMDPVAAIERSTFPAMLSNETGNFGLTETHLFSPTLLHTFRFAYTQHDVPWKERTVSLTTDNFTDGSLATWGPDTSEFSDDNEAFIFNDNVSWTKERHSVTAGVEYRRIRDDGAGFACGGANGTYFFEPGQALPAAVPSASGLNNLAAGSPSPSSLVSFMLGDPSTYLKSVGFKGYPTDGGASAGGWRRYHLAGFIQDDIKVNAKLTLNLGFRYEYNSVPVEAGDRDFGMIDSGSLVGSPVFHRVVLNPSFLYKTDYRGVQPRFGVAYKLNDKTVWRGGFGVFTNLPLTQTAEQQGFGQVSGVSENPVFSAVTQPSVGPALTDLSGNPILPPDGDTKKIPRNTPLNLAPIEQFLGGPFIFDVADQNYANGYTMAGNLTFERQLPGDVAFQAAYVMNNAVRLSASDYPNAYAGALPAYTPYTLVDPSVSEFQFTDSHAHSTYNSLQMMAHKTSTAHGIEFQASYTYSKAIDNASTVFNGPPGNSDELQNNPTCWRCEKAVSAFDFPQRFVANLTYTAPFDKWQALSSAPRRLTQGWQITSILQRQSGFPFTVTSPYGTVPYGTDIYVGFQATRPDLVQQPTLKTGPGPEEQFFSDAVVSDGVNVGQQYFATPGALTTGVQDHPGDLGRNTFRTHPFSNIDFSLLKDTKMTESTSVQFRAEFFNLFNQHAFNIPSAILGDPGFGIANSTVLPEREIQLGLKLIF